MHTQTMVRAAVLTNYMEVAAELGLNTVAELRLVGLTAKMLMGPDTPIPFSAAVQLLEQSAKRSGYANLGLRMAERRRLSDFGVASLLLPHQRTPRDAILMTIHYRHLLNESLVLAIEEKPKTSVIREEVLTDTPMLATQVTELGVAMILLTFRAMIGGHWRPQGAHFTHAGPKDLRCTNDCSNARCTSTATLAASVASQATSIKKTRWPTQRWLTTPARSLMRCQGGRKTQWFPKYDA